MSCNQEFVHSADCNQMPRNLPDLPILYNLRLEVILVHWVSPHEFYIQLKSSKENFDLMTKELQMFYNKQYVKNSFINKYVVVLDKNRQEYVRGMAGEWDRSGLLSGSHKPTCNVKLLDYGNEIHCEEQEINELRDPFMSLPAMAVKCSLRGISLNCPHKETADDIKEFLHSNELQTQCAFIKTVEDIHLVDLFIEGQNLRNQLVSKGVVAELPIDFEYNLLENQVLRLRLSWIDDLTYFRVQFVDSSIKTALACSFYDLQIHYKYDRPSRLHELKRKIYHDFSPKFKRLYESKDVIATVKGVTNRNILLLEIYIPELYVPDCYKLRQPIPRYPILSRTLQCQISHVNCEKGVAVFIKNVQHKERNDEFNEDLNKFYENSGVPLIIKTPRTICAALSSNGRYYRGVICEDYNDGQVLVQFIDNGRKEVIKEKKLKQLDEAHQIESAFAVKSYLAIRSAKSREILESEILKITTGECSLYTNIIQPSNGTWIIDVLIENGDIRNSLCSYLIQNNFAYDISLDILNSNIETFAFSD